MVDYFELKKRFSLNILRDAMIHGEKKIEFLRALTDWIEQWCQSPAYTVFSQPASALTTILGDHAILYRRLTEWGFCDNCSSDPVDRHFSQYRRMSGGRFLVNLREVLISERILWSCSLIKENVNFLGRGSCIWKSGECYRNWGMFWY